MRDLSSQQAKNSTKMKQLEYLKSMRFNSPGGEVTEELIVRDLLFVFQGI